MRLLPRRLATGLTAAALAATLAACSSPVRLATPAEIRQANAPRPSNTAGQASPGTSGPSAAASPSPAANAQPSPAPSTPAGSGALAQLQAELRRLVDLVTPSVVQVQAGNGLGSGIVMDQQGDVVTNAHVVASSGNLRVTTADGHSFPASLVGSFASNDLAVIRMSGASGLKPAGFGDSSQVHVGDIVLAIGSPLGLGDSVSEGIVSATGRSEPEGNGVTLTDLIQTTAATNHGNSGGALVDINGKVIGMPTLGAGSTGGGGTASGIGFAIPSNQVTSVSRQLLSGGGVSHTGIPYLGITTSSSSSGGAQVADVVSGGPADKAGVRAGWLITALAGHAVAGSSTISQILASHKPGDRVDLTARLPDGSQRTVSVTLGERPANP